MTADKEICCECQYRRSNGCGRGRCVYEDFVEENKINGIKRLKTVVCKAKSWYNENKKELCHDGNLEGRKRL